MILVFHHCGQFIISIMEFLFFLGNQLVYLYRPTQKYTYQIYSMIHVIWFGVNWNNIWARLWKMIILGPLWWVDRSSWKAVEGSGLLGSKRIISSGHLHCPLSGATSRLPTQVSRQGAKLTRDPEKVPRWPKKFPFQIPPWHFGNGCCAHTVGSSSAGKHENSYPHLIKKQAEY